MYRQQRRKRTSTKAGHERFEVQKAVSDFKRFTAGDGQERKGESTVASWQKRHDSRQEFLLPTPYSLIKRTF